MKILITNDDCIKSEGLYLLAKAAKKYGEVVIIAPLHEQSGKSHSIEIKEGLELAEYDLGLDVPTYTFASTPADCVRVAHYGLKLDFDIVFSGINNGLNVGEDIHYSGTVAAITEAALLNKKGIAFSTNTKSFMNIINNFDKIMEVILNNDLFKYSKIFNVNAPNNPRDIVFTHQGSTHFNTIFMFEDNKYYQRGHTQFELDKDNVGSDVWAMYNNYISITPLNYDRTDYKVLDKLNNLS